MNISEDGQVEQMASVNVLTISLTFAALYEYPIYNRFWLSYSASLDQ